MATTARYIALEGAEGCGKSTQASWLAGDLDAVLTREQGGTPIGQFIRAIVLDPDHTELDHRAEALLNAADRAQHLAEVVEPALAAGRHVVSDRSIYSTLAYQGYGRSLPLDEIRHINEWAVRGRWPDLAILIEVDPARLTERLRSRTLDRFERESVHFHERVRHGFAEMAAHDSHHWVVIDGNHPAKAVRTAIREAVAQRLGV